MRVGDDICRGILERIYREARICFLKRCFDLEDAWGISFTARKSLLNKYLLNALVQNRNTKMQNLQRKMSCKAKSAICL